MKKITMSLVAIFFGLTIWAQPTTKDYIKEGNAALITKNYSGAMYYLSEALDRDPSNTAVRYNLIQAGKKQYAYSFVEKHLHYLLDTIKSAEFPKAYKELADLKFQLGKYQEAEKYYNLFLSENDDALSKSKVELSLESAKWAQLNSDLEEGITTENLDFNTAYSEHAPVMIDGKLSYSSLSVPFKSDKHEPKRFISKVKGGLEDAKGMDAFNSDNLLTSNATISPDGKYLAYTLCSFINSSDINCKLYLSKKDAEGNWGRANVAPSPVNQEGATSTHPNFGKINGNKYELYFVSDRTGGKGGMDIYKTSFNMAYQFSAVENLGEINTRASDITPFYDANEDALYFSSNGRVGYGSFDVYVSKDNTIENLGKPINTSFQDIYYARFNDGESTYLSSNRPGSKYLDQKFETCCFDIYRVNEDIKKIDLLALTYDASTNAELIGAKVLLQNLDGTQIGDIENISSNEFLFENIKIDQEYKLIASKEGFEDAMVVVTGAELLEALKEGKLIKKLYLKPESVDLLITVFEKPSDKPLNGATVSLIDITAGDVEVDRITLGSSNKFSFKVIPGHCYKIRVNKTGYEQVIEKYCIPTDGSKAEKKVYLRREAVIETLANLIPLKLYFDNDLPDKSTMNVTTETIYTQTYANYYPRKDYFKKVYANQFGASQLDVKNSEVESFFENDVRQGREKLDMFLETLTRILQNGKSVNLFLRGYASPLSVNEYNTALGKRRVDCIRNEFERYSGGVLLNYINSGQLVITERSFGEETADNAVSDDPNTPKKSIFSPQASRERRVEIDEIKEILNN